MRHKTLLAIVCATVMVAGVLAGVELRAQAALPEGAALVDGYVKATGGRAAFDRLTTRVAKARTDVTGANVSMAVTMWAARPNRALTIVESDLLGRIERGFDDTVGWELSTTGGPRVLEGNELDDAARDNVFDGLVSWRDWVAKLETQGPAVVDGRPAWKVLLTPKVGSARTYYFDQASALVVEVETIVRTSAGDVPVAVFASDYRDVRGVLLPYRLRQVAAGRELVTTFDSITHNVEIPAGRFDLPKEVLALVPKK
jgi:zinc protease